MHSTRPELTWIDLVTTGSDPHRHEVIGFAAYSPAIGSLSGRVIPMHPELAEPSALAAVGYSPERWASLGAVPAASHAENELFARLAPLLEGKTLINWNVHFDVSFFRTWLMRLGTKRPRPNYHAIDVASLYAPIALTYGLPLSIAGAAEAFSIQRPDDTPESALHFAMQVYDRICDYTIKGLTQ